MNKPKIGDIVFFNCNGVGHLDNSKYNREDYSLSVASQKYVLYNIEKDNLSNYYYLIYKNINNSKKVVLKLGKVNFSFVRKIRDAETFWTNIHGNVIKLTELAKDTSYAKNVINMLYRKGKSRQDKFASIIAVLRYHMKEKRDLSLSEKLLLFVKIAKFANKCNGEDFVPSMNNYKIIYNHPAGSLNIVRLSTSSNTDIVFKEYSDAKEAIRIFGNIAFKQISKIY